MNRFLFFTVSSANEKPHSQGYIREGCPNPLPPSPPRLLIPPPYLDYSTPVVKKKDQEPKHAVHKNVLEIVLIISNIVIIKSVILPTTSRDLPLNLLAQVRLFAAVRGGLEQMMQETLSTNESQSFGPTRQHRVSILINSAKHRTPSVSNKQN